MSTKFLTWTLHAPSDYNFKNYMKNTGANWYDNQWTPVDLNSINSWNYQEISFVQMIQKYPEKFYAIGLHNFQTDNNGHIATGFDNFSSTPSYILNSDQTQIATPLPQSLLWLMQTYPQIKWSITFIAVNEITNGTPTRINNLLDNVNGIQDTFIAEAKKICQLYKDAGFDMIKGVEIDWEKPSTRKGDGTPGSSDWEKYAVVIQRLKNEVCLPLGLELRANLLAMTDDFVPDYYAWHDYGTLATAKDVNGNPALDELQLMTYDFSWGGSAPGPSTPFDWLQKVINHIVKLNSQGKLNINNVFIGNAGYGRRWPLGETDFKTLDDRMGSTLDYKQLMLAQNGTYIHNPGYAQSINAYNDTPDGNWYFWNQDFIPITGFNDDASDYQRTYLNVYDRFALTQNGGAEYNNINFNNAKGYVENYSRRQWPIFTGVVAHDFVGTNNLTTYNNGNGEGSRMSRYSADGSDTLKVAPRTSGIDLSSVNYGYSTMPAKAPPSVDGEVTYTLNATGNYYLIALVNYPFFTKANIPFSFNGTSGYAANIFGQDWYPFMQTQEIHFAQMIGPNGDGTFTFNGTNTIQVGVTNGAQIWGFVACQAFDYNIRGGEITFPTYCMPMLRRDTVDSDGNVTFKNAQYPDNFRLVGELLRTPPRPAIIWEDVFGSYPLGDTTGFSEPTSSQYLYYSTINETINSSGYSINSWTIEAPDANDSTDVQHLFNDSTGTTSQFAVNNQFSSNIALDMVFAPKATKGIFGCRALMTEKSLYSGYYFEMNFVEQKINVYYYPSSTSNSVLAYSVDMDDALIALDGQEIEMFVYFFNDRLSVWVEKSVYIDRKPMPFQPGSGAYGIFGKNTKLKCYKFNISTLDRYERMERVEVIVDGQTYSFGDVPRTCSYDTWGFLEYSGYPADIANQIALPETDNGTGSGIPVGGSSSDTTVISTQQNTSYKWYNDYKTKKLASVPSWQQGKDVIFRMVDAGVWLRTFYIGDNNGMSVAYNGDRNAFIKTANLVNDYGFKGIGMWTLGQEDPTIYPYISG